jgi:hypothetical protein
MLGVTSHISTDIAAIPLLWVVPLGIYLATFVVAFSRTARTAPVRVTKAAVALSYAGVVGSLAAGGVPVPIAIGANLVILAVVALAAHARLAADRPSTELLTAYYMVIAAGGALGGLLNGLLAPIIFDRVLEYPLALTVVPLLLVGLGATPDTWLGRQLRANRVRAALVLTLIVLVPLGLRTTIWVAESSNTTVLILLVVAVVSGWFLGQIPRAMVVSLAALYVIAAVGDSRQVIDQTRTFFGTYSVKSHDGIHKLIHGTTIHGTQMRQGQELEEPTTYYSRQGPLGDALTIADPSSVAAIGLGAGTVATYGQPGQKMTFFEIDPEIVRIASDPSLFSYVEDSEADIEMVLGDGRLRIAEQASGSFDAIILDAFSSDSIPVHLLTEEAMETYADRLTDDGVLLVHISNRVFDLAPVVASAASHLGWESAIGTDQGTSPGATPSTWIAIAPQASLVDGLLAGPGWSHLDDRRVRWTDDYSSILSVLR